MIWVTCRVPQRSAANHRGNVRECHVVWRVATLNTTLAMSHGSISRQKITLVAGFVYCTWLLFGDRLNFIRLKAPSRGNGVWTTCPTLLCSSVASTRYQDSNLQPSDRKSDALLLDEWGSSRYLVLYVHTLLISFVVTSYSKWHKVWLHEFHVFCSISSWSRYGSRRITEDRNKTWRVNSTFGQWSSPVDWCSWT